MKKLEKLSDYLREYESEKLDKVFEKNDKNVLDGYIESQIGATELSYIRDILMDIDAYTNIFYFSVSYSFIDPYVKMHPLTYENIKKAYSSKDYIYDFGFTENQTFDRTQFLFDNVIGSGDNADILGFDFDVYEIDEKTFVKEVIKEIERVIDEVVGEGLKDMKHIMSTEVSYHEKTKDLPIYIDHSTGELAIGNI